MSGPELDFEKKIAELEKHIAELRSFASRGHWDISEQIAKLEQQIDEEKKRIFGSLTAWQRIQLVRHPNRPYTLDYIKLLTTDFIELSGDRFFGDDKAIIGGWGKFENRTVMIIGHQKGRDTKENLKRNFGMAHPEGYRKAMRLMKTAEKFKKPVITFLDTPGAYPSIGAEERGQAWTIASNLKEMSQLKVPIVTVVIGEGGSGGALGIGVGNKIFMLEYAIYSVCSPEACAAILWKDRNKAQKAAASLKLTARDLQESGVIDGIISEPLGGAHRNYKSAADNIKKILVESLDELGKYSEEKLIRNRQLKYRKIGNFFEAGGPRNPSATEDLETQAETRQTEQ
jgi:acetyl-CoA carboxylase carboxyl transferase subunit alpha